MLLSKQRENSVSLLHRGTTQLSIVYFLCINSAEGKELKKKKKKLRDPFAIAPLNQSSERSNSSGCFLLYIRARRLF